MKSKIKAVFLLAIKHLFMYAYGINKTFFEALIIDLYQGVRKDEFIVKSEIVQVKKGERKYKVAFFETREGKLKINMGRHHHEHSTTF